MRDLSSTMKSFWARQRRRDSNRPEPVQPEMGQTGMQPGRKKGPVVALVLVLVLLAAVLCVLLVLVVGKGFKQTQTTAEEPKTERTERLREADTETERMNWLRYTWARQRTSTMI